MASPCIKYAVGRMNKRVTLQEYRLTPHGQGGTTKAWSDVITIWAEITPKKGYERMQAMQIETPITHAIRCRYNSDITVDKRFLFNGRKFVIKEVLNQNEDNAFLEVLCIENTDT